MVAGLLQQHLIQHFGTRVCFLVILCESFLSVQQLATSTFLMIQAISFEMIQHPLQTSKRKHLLLRLIVVKYTFNKQRMLLTLKGEFKQVSSTSLLMIHGNDETEHIHDREQEKLIFHYHRQLIMRDLFREELWQNVQARVQLTCVQ